MSQRKCAEIGRTFNTLNVNAGPRTTTAVLRRDARCSQDKRTVCVECDRRREAAENAALAESEERNSKRRPSRSPAKASVRDRFSSRCSSPALFSGTPAFSPLLFSPLLSFVTAFFSSASELAMSDSLTFLMEAQTLLVIQLVHASVRADELTQARALHSSSKNES